MQRKRPLKDMHEGQKQESFREESPPTKLQKTESQFDVKRRCYRKFKKHAKLFNTSERMKGILLSCKQGKEAQAVTEILPIFHEHCDELEKQFSASSSKEPNESEQNNTNVVACLQTEPDPNATQTTSVTMQPLSLNNNISPVLQPMTVTATTTTTTVISDESSDDSDDEDEILDKEYCGEPKEKSKRFEVYDAKTSGLVVIRIVSERISPVKLVRRVLKREANRKFRFCCRIVPLEGICQANTNVILSRIKPFIAKHFHKEPKRTLKYAVVYKSRNNNTVDRMQLIDGIVEIVGTEWHSVCLDSPEVVILIEIFKSACGFAVVKDFYTLHRFNLSLQTENSKFG
jgi:tRNA(Ser,Leu) C12 N-acetylase TAN1